MQNLPLHIYSAFQDAEQPEVLLRGFQKYLSAECELNTTPFEVVKQIKETSLRYYPSNKKSSKTIFIIPSLINGPEIFDLSSDQSFIRYMNDQNYNIYMLEWGGFI